MSLSDRVASIVAFLRAGHPNGAPALGYTPLLALLPRRVSDDEITTIARKLLAPRRRSVDHVDVGVEITRVTDELPSVDEIGRVQRRLSATGWAGPHHG
ncbi:DUF3349 domain-containing protein [Mycobacterium paraseoulense]|uniref:DUF3349 domain-containing protein n=1 Tax=Mycobacterium paraseoulense TaxID=590652 RepID=A0A1X0I789_9MYCO|nr:DUF3349 domain-containing protein [Mycobacterium paraseoulense]MCV7394259.1 DUF3349 domain-containing protein [Mycobacterium paraseoulense]ORB37661.1 hypothetical protein BST39_18405 [Mycobacterium paraseoulense]BBZ74019.1 hypothetical protein MPRS_51120 [Mycobacterium paraseoulense]